MKLDNLNDIIKYDKDFTLFKKQFEDTALEYLDFNGINRRIFSIFELKYYYCSKKNLKQVIQSAINNLCFNDLLYWINICNSDNIYYKEHLIYFDNLCSQIEPSVKRLIHYNNNDYYDIQHIVLYVIQRFTLFVLKTIKEKHKYEKCN